KAKRAGVVRYERITDVVNDKGERIALTRNTGEIHVLGPKDKPLESFSVPNGAVLMVADGAPVQPGQLLCRWDPHITPIIADRGGKVRFEEIVEGQTLRKEKDESTGAERWVIMEHKGDLHPQIVIEDDRGQPLTTYYLPEKAFLEVRDGVRVSAGTLLAKTSREVAGTQDITGGLPRVTEIFEARTPRDPAKMAEIAGVVRLGEKKRGKRLIYIKPVDDEGREVPDAPEMEHQVPPGKHLRVRAGDRVKAGDRLGDGPPGPAGAAGDPKDLGPGGGAAVPGHRGAVGLPGPARRDRRQAHRDHRVADAAQGEGREDGRHGPVARLGHRPLRLPGGQQPPQEV